MINIFLYCFLILFFVIDKGKAGDVTVTLIGIDPLTINIKGDTQNEEAGSLNIYLYYRDDGVTDLNINNVDVTQVTNTFGWGSGFQEEKEIQDGIYDKGVYTFTKRLFYANVDLSGSPDDYWTTSGIDAIDIDFTTVGTGHAYVEVNGDGLADWSGTGHSVTYASQDISLPVELSSFVTDVSNNKVTLSWVIESEINNLGFEVYRALEEEGAYLLLSSYATNPDLLGQGNSSTSHEYSFTDETVEPEKTYWYKLADVEYNGNKVFHERISVTVPVAPLIPDTFQLFQNYPNPFNPVTKIKYGLPISGRVKIDIYNIISQKVLTILDDFKNAGYHTMDFNAGNLTSGVYLYQIRTGEFSSVKKMILIK